MIEDAKQSNKHMQTLTAYVINGWSITKVEVKPDIQQFWPFCSDIAFIDGEALKGGRIKC